MNPIFDQQEKDNRLLESGLIGVTSLNPAALKLFAEVTEKLAGNLKDSDLLHSLNDALVRHGVKSVLDPRPLKVIDEKPVTKPNVQLSPAPNTIKLSM